MGSRFFNEVITDWTVLSQGGPTAFWSALEKAVGVCCDVFVAAALRYTAKSSTADPAYSFSSSVFEEGHFEHRCSSAEKASSPLLAPRKAKSARETWNSSATVHIYISCTGMACLILCHRLAMFN